MEAIIEQVSNYELERGKPMPTLNHAYLQASLLAELRTRYRRTHTFLSELNITMPERPDAVPDIAIYAKLPVDFLHDITSMTTMPLTVIEIISPSQSQEEMTTKFERYFSAGVQSCWLVMPTLQAIAVYSEIGKYQFFTSDTTLTDFKTGISLVLNDVFGE